MHGIAVIKNIKIYFINFAKCKSNPFNDVNSDKALASFARQYYLAANFQLFLSHASHLKNLNLLFSVYLDGRHGRDVN